MLEIMAPADPQTPSPRAVGQDSCATAKPFPLPTIGSGGHRRPIAVAQASLMRRRHQPTLSTKPSGRGYLANPQDRRRPRTDPACHPCSHQTDPECRRSGSRGRSVELIVLVISADRGALASRLRPDNVRIRRGRCSAPETKKRAAREQPSSPGRYPGLGVDPPKSGELSGGSCRRRSRLRSQSRPSTYPDHDQVLRRSHDTEPIL